MNAERSDDKQPQPGGLGQAQQLPKRFRHSAAAQSRSFFDLRCRNFLYEQ